ncbi:MAG: protein kinase [Longimicrobiales bacterium]
MSDALPRLNAALSGRYTLERELGQGGMATVYLAHDLKHGRKVALKVLKPELAAVIGAERFLAEIRMTASLQHPHILPLHDSGSADGLLFYVMPHVEGESLRERLDREHQLPVDDAVRIAINVAEALDYAHSRGVIHRDIKPENILLHAGKPVISDFGIALAVSSGGSGRLTETGMSLGTPHYMSPEQATGDVGVGAATDIYALGCVLYEMLVGEPPYTGSTPQAILGKIITGALPSASGQRRSVPANVDAAIRKALEKVPADRFANASDLARALADRGFTHGEVADAAAAGTAFRLRWSPLATAGWSLAALLALGLALSITSSPSAEPPAVGRFDVTPIDEQGFVTAVDGVDLALTPDGSRIVYVGAAPGGGSQLWVRRIDDLDAVPLPGTEGAGGPAVSPDGLTVAFQGAGAIRTVAIGGGPATTVTSSADPAAGHAFGPDGIYFGAESILYRVSTAGGEPEAITAPTAGARHLHPDVLPEGRGILFTMFRGSTLDSSIGVVGPDGGEAKEILTGGMARYVATGHVVYLTTGGTLMAAPFDLRRLEVTGPSTALVERLYFKSSLAANFALSYSGTLLYATRGGGDVTELVWVSRTGSATSVDPAWTGVFGSPTLSPDARRVAMTVVSGPTQAVWVKQLDRGPTLRLSFEGTENNYPIWTPDGASVTYYSNRAGLSADIWTQRADGSGQAVIQLDREEPLTESLWSPDGEWLVYRTDFDGPGAGDILAFRPGRDTLPMPLVATRFAETAPAISPDGRWLAYASNETGRSEIYVVPFPDVGNARWAVSPGGGSEPTWPRSGKEILYRNGQGEMVSVQVETEPTFSTGRTNVLFSTSEYFASQFHRTYDVTADGERFLMMRPVSGDIRPNVILVLNFFEELRELAPE